MPIHTFLITSFIITNLFGMLFPTFKFKFTESIIVEETFYSIISEISLIFCHSEFESFLLCSPQGTVTGEGHQLQFLLPEFPLFDQQLFMKVPGSKQTSNTQL
jgi:hypothetical protein